MFFKLLEGGHLERLCHVRSDDSWSFDRIAVVKTIAFVLKMADLSSKVGALIVGEITSCSGCSSL